MTPEINAAFVGVSIFVFGAFAGAWWSERSQRLASNKNTQGRINVSMPAKAKDAKVMMRLLAELIAQAEAEGLDVPSTDKVAA